MKMSIQDYETAKGLIKSSSKVSTFRGRKDERLIDVAERELSVEFPKSYRKFLQEFGSGGLGSFEIYGLINDNFVNSGIPDVVWLTNKGRKEWNLPKFLIPIYDLGDGELFCVDLRTLKEGEAEIVAYTPGYSINNEKLEKVADDFGTLFLYLMKQEEG
jgi:antitoxin YobK